MSIQPTELQRARWWRSGWASAYDKAIALDRLTVRIERREWRSIVRYYRSRRKAGERSECSTRRLVDKKTPSAEPSQAQTENNL